MGRAAVCVKLSGLFGGELAIDGAGGDPEQLRGQALVAAGVRERGVNHAPLDLLERSADQKRQLDSLGSRRRALRIAKTGPQREYDRHECDKWAVVHILCRGVRLTIGAQPRAGFARFDLARRAFRLVGCSGLLGSLRLELSVDSFRSGLEVSEERRTQPAFDA